MAATDLPLNTPPRPQARVLDANEQRQADLQAQGSGRSRIHNPVLKTLATVGDILLGTFAPRAEMLTPGTEGNYMMHLARANAAVKGEQEGAENEARTRLQEAQAQNQEAEAQARLHPNTKLSPENLQKTLVTDQGIMQWNPDTNRFDIPAGQAPAKEETEGKTVTTDQGIMQWDPKTKTYGIKVGDAPGAKGGTVHQADDGTFIMAHPDGTATTITIDGKPVQGKKPEEKPETEIIHKEVAGKAHNVMVKKGTGEVVADLGEIGEKLSTADHGVTMIDPTTGRVMRLEPGQTAPQGILTPTQLGTQNAPTTQMRNVGAQAQLVHEQTPYMLSELDRLKNKIGPYSGRWNEFMQGKVGLNDPDMAGLRTDLLMYSSAVALMHARGRLPENLREEFDRAINAPQQDAGNLKSAIQHIDRWTAANMQQMGAGGAGARGAGATSEEWVRDPNTGKLVKK